MLSYEQGEGGGERKLAMREQFYHGDESERCRDERGERNM